MGPLIPTINHWADTSRAIDIKGYKSTASVLIEDESIEIDCEPGLHIKFKCTPLEDNVVKIKGVIISSKESEKNLIKPKLIYPFTVSCELGKTTTAFELKTELEQ